MWRCASRDQRPHRSWQFATIRWWQQLLQLPGSHWQGPTSAQCSNTEKEQKIRRGVATEALSASLPPPTWYQSLLLPRDHSSRVTSFFSYLPPTLPSPLLLIDPLSHVLLLLSATYLP